MKEILDDLSYGAVEKLSTLASKHNQDNSKFESPSATESCALSYQVQYVPQKPWEPDTSALADLTELVATGGESLAAREFTMRYDGATATLSTVDNRGAKKSLVMKLSTTLNLISLIIL